MTKTLQYDNISIIADPSTQRRFLPTNMLNCDNSTDIEVYRLALKTARCTLLNDEERMLLSEYYENNKKQIDIAFDMGVSVSSISKKIKKIEKKLQNYLQFFAQAYKNVKFILVEEFDIS